MTLPFNLQRFYISGATNNNTLISNPQDNLSHVKLCLCGNGEKFGPISNKYGDFTLCFNNLLLILSALLMIIVGSYQTSQLNKSKNIYKYRRNWLIFSRITLILIQFVFIGINVIIIRNNNSLDFMLQEILTLLSLLVALNLHWIEYNKSKLSNGVLLFYWLFETFFQASLLLHIYIRYDYEGYWFNDSKNFMVLRIFETTNAFFILLLEWLPRKPTLPYQNLMQQEYLKKKKSPYDEANIFSKISFSWMTGLMKTGYEKFLSEDDLYKLPNSFGSAEISNKMSSIMNKNPTVSLALSLFREFWPKIVLGASFKIVYDILSFTQPQLLRLLIKFVTDYNQNKNEGNDPENYPIVKGFILAISMFLVGFIQTCILHQYFLTSYDTGMNIKSGLTSIVYQKALNLSNEASDMSSTGDIVNLMSVDVQRLQDLNQWGHIIWSGPFQIILCLISLYKLLGNCMWVGVLIMLIMIPLNSIIVRKQKTLQKTQMKNKDERTRITSEILNNIKSLKLYAWEIPYKAKLDHVRNDKELRNLKKIGVVQAISNFQFNIVPFLVSCSTFATFVLTNNGKPLTTDLVFPALALFNLLAFPLAVVPMAITSFVEASISVNRLSKFLNNEELQKDAVKHEPSVTKVGDVSVKLSDATFLWKRKPEYKIALSNINFEARKGQLNCVVGKVGAGKTALIKSILGDLYRVQGEAIVHGNVAYVSQLAWIMNGTVKENILFGHKYDPDFYEKTIKACALTIDFAGLSKGDQTIVGEKGISLSGGQKARLSLARAVYARADVYLLDDPLAAVDEHVSKHLVEHVLGPNGLLHSKTRVLVTNKISVLLIADCISLLEGGQIVEHGSYESILKTGNENSALAKLIEEFGNRKKENEGDSKVDLKELVTGDLSDTDEDFYASSLRKASDETLRSIGFFPSGEDGGDVDVSRREHREQGKVKWDIYFEYARSCNPKFVVVFIIFLILNMVLSVAGNFWLKHWSEVNTRLGYNPNISKYLGIYFSFGIGSALATLASVIILWIFCTISGSRILHDRMAASVLRAPMSFFETTPIGRILNRFSNDIYKIDEVLGRSFSQFFNNSIKVSFTILVICFTTWQFIFFVIPIGMLYIYYQQYYLRTSRELRRLDSVTRSPVYAHFQETLGGITTIRGYGQQTRFIHLNRCFIDNNMSAYYPSINANRWLAFRLETIGSFIIFCAAMLSVFRLRQGTLSAGAIGLSLSYALQITQSLNWIVRMSVEVESNIVSVERVKEYANLKSEAPAIIPGHRPPESWPDKGEIKFVDYSTRYRPELPLVLHDINLSIESREKIGIVGRTGAGKSSLTLALFRIIEASSGHIEIDGINTSTIGLADLRHKLSIIPQDSQVFEGSIRENIDPTGLYSDEQIWEALELSHLKQHVETLGGLDSELSEGGGNLSVGQRQLMCLARALLIPSKVLVLDEATAAVDVETDQVLQETIRTAFKDRTILTIAHRLNTIMDSDRIIVLEQGKVAEFDSPDNLLKDKSTIFYGLCKEAGLATA
ncbi:probable Metal resistance protein YCF1 [Saccharomycodes ludwigii]|uniref:Probable Metal resistance protein YCF1 n=1 Tax=Saccharomycodes ludwigii TaxID=36035 RepID=A0A376B1B4_9ASCO|nr:hypothetical protein SCDLUD_001738 [Saccharomycodes ludwigii]KAH3901952.1 hypothetical protein SCDLUD_001738 [Saccharomycodes ludwigii]SSD58475.1 probable Metal resistance protein YCF1 [Saccharomycodes ludwigii]